MGEIFMTGREALKPDERQLQTMGPSLTRRQLLAGTGQVALLVTVPLACTPVADKAWADGTFWDDGYGWTA